MTKRDLSRTIIKEISRQEVKMRPKLYFVLGAAITALGLVGAMLSSMIFISFFFLRLKTGAPFAFLRFGRLGIRPFLGIFPFWPILLSAACLGLGWFILKKQEFVYLQRLAVVLVSVLSLVFFGGLLFYRFNISRQLSQRRPFASLGLNKSTNHHWLIGQIESVENDYLLVVMPNGEVIKVISSESRSSLRAEEESLIGRQVRIVGQWQGKSFLSQGLMVAPQSTPTRPPGAFFPGKRRCW